jgi:hypothetical protein
MTSSNGGRMNLNSIVVCEAVPQEIRETIRGQLVSNLVAPNEEIMNRTNHAPLVKDLTSQVELLFASVKKANKHFWPARLQPGTLLNEYPPGLFSEGDPEETQSVLIESYDAWVETPGAIDVIRGLVKKDQDAN